jgi:Flp pilus assembly protein TadD
MRRLRSTRDDGQDEGDLSGPEPFELEGDPIMVDGDAIASLRPFGREIADRSLGNPGVGDPPPEEEPRRRARELASNGRRLEAIKLLSLHCSDRPEVVVSRVELAGLLDEAGDPDGALAHLSAAHAIEPQSALVLIRRGALHAHSGRVAAAERDFAEAIRIRPTDGVAYRYLGIARLRRGVPVEAVIQLRQAIDRDPADGEATLHLGEALAALGQVEEALGILQRAGALCPSDPRSYLLRGRLLDRLGRTEEAMAMHRQAREVTTA